MRRLLVGSGWFDLLSTSALVEAEYERVLAASAHLIFPDFFFVPFKIRIESPDGAKKADFALIDKQYRRWWVVEVELAHHPLHGHVLPQVEVLVSGLYGKEHASHLASQDERLDAPLLEEMMLGDQPRVLVIVNANSDEWRGYLRAYQVELLVIEIFRSDKNEYALEARGAQPVIDENLLTRCARDPYLLNMFVVEAPAALGFSATEPITIEYDGATADWRRVDGADRVWIAPMRGCPIPAAAQHFELVRSGEAFLSIRIVD